MHPGADPGRRPSPPVEEILRLGIHALGVNQMSQYVLANLLYIFFMIVILYSFNSLYRNEQTCGIR